MKLELPFFEMPAIELASALIGKIIVRRVQRNVFRARIVETEAYVGTHDLASHASKGRTNRTEVMFGPAGRAYVYLIYGMHEMFNIVAGAIDDPQAVLIRAAEPLDAWSADLSGPGKLTRSLQITRAENGVALSTDRLHILDNPADQPQIIATPRIGIDYAQEWKHELLRFIDPTSKALSSKVGLAGTGIPSDSPSGLPQLFSTPQTDREVVASQLPTKYTKSTKGSENETRDANFQFCHVEIHE